MRAARTEAGSWIGWIVVSGYVGFCILAYLT
jgi:hypothetical protein